jgi:hypothetical protein
MFRVNQGQQASEVPGARAELAVLAATDPVA